jgi:hypothetical protein
MQFPTFQKKSPLTAADLNSMVDTLKRARVLPGVGIKLTETLNGTVISLKPVRAGGGGSTTTDHYPWEIVNLVGVGEPNQQGEYSSYEFSVWPGVVNGIMPPNLFDGGELAKFTASSSVQNVILKCTSDGKGIISATVDVSGTVPSPKPAVKFGLPNELNILLAVVYKSTAYQIESTNLTATPYTVGIAEKSNVTDGQYPYDVFLNWQYHQAASGGSFGGGGFPPFY